MTDLLTLALTSHALSGTPIKRQLWRELRSKVAESKDGEELQAWVAKSLNSADAALVVERLELLEEAFELKESLGNDGISLLTEFDDSYPIAWKERLKDAHPALLFVAGNARLLGEAQIGIVGSRDVDDAGSQFAQAVAEEAVRLGYGVVSGGARGVDQISMKATYDCGGNSVGILADSLRSTATKRGTADALESGRVCLVSPFSPSAGFQVGNAMGRNKLIYALSVGTVVVSAAEGSGGTWAGAVEALESGYCPVLVRIGNGVPDGNSKLVKKGGAPMAVPSDLESALTHDGAAQPTLL
jgi:predicted Rossmann fold nucleotide-binding protein DprA/Smf involved in DNA uptake